MRITLLTGFHFQLHGVPSHDQGSPCQDSRILISRGFGFSSGSSHCLPESSEIKAGGELYADEARG